MKAILIDPTTQTVTPYNLDKGIAAIYAALGCSTFTCIDIGIGETLYLDDEGLLKDEPGPFFQIAGYPQPLAGKGLILGTDEEGNSRSTSLISSAVRAKVTFPDVRFTGFTHEEGEVEHPILGKAFCLSTTPHFEAK